MTKAFFDLLVGLGYEVVYDVETEKIDITAFGETVRTFIPVLIKHRIKIEDKRGPKVYEGQDLHRLEQEILEDILSMSGMSIGVTWK